MPIKVIYTMSGTRHRVLMRKGTERSVRQFGVDTVSQQSMQRYLASKQRKGWAL